MPLEDKCAACPTLWPSIPNAEQELNMYVLIDEGQNKRALTKVNLDPNPVQNWIISDPVDYQATNHPPQAVVSLDKQDTDNDQRSAPWQVLGSVLGTQE